jgi:Pyruvate/2-oxoacid:ferredoxin oxidoreductase delta subunit
MTPPAMPMHFVSTHTEARTLIDDHERFWVSNCGCREARGGCARSRVDVCLIFVEQDGGSGSYRRAITRVEAEAVLRTAGDRHLVARPFRDVHTGACEGICFCCDDCCGYFRDPAEACDKGAFIESTHLDTCTHCGDCVALCYFHARVLKENRLELTRESCYGCGLCADGCPMDCVALVPRG